MKKLIKYSYLYTMIFLTILIAGCSFEKKTNESHQKGESIFPKGEKVTSNNFSGTVWLEMMGASDSTLYAGFGHVTFEPGARTNWHSHPGGQVLFITLGQGFYQAEGQPALLVRKGEVVEIPRNVVHWHGAGPDSLFAHIAVSLNTNDGSVVWLGPVTEKEYNTGIENE